MGQDETNDHLAAPVVLNSLRPMWREEVNLFQTREIGSTTLAKQLQSENVNCGWSHELKKLHPASFKNNICSREKTIELYDNTSIWNNSMARKVGVDAINKIRNITFHNSRKASMTVRR